MTVFEIFCESCNTDSFVESKQPPKFCPVCGSEVDDTNIAEEEWQEDVEERGGWIVCIGMPEASQYDFRKAHIDRFVELISYSEWRTTQPIHLFTAIDNKMLRRLNK